MKQVAPDEGYYAGDGHSYDAEGEWEYSGESKVVIHGKNLDAVNAQKVHVVLEGELE